MMSTTGNQSVGQPDYSVFGWFRSPPYQDREGYIQWQIRSRKAIGSPRYPLDEKDTAEVAGLAWDRDHDSLSMMRQAAAVIKSGDRTGKLASIQ